MDNTKLINELYWFCEDLVAYTDLTGNRFDIDHAQRRLWPMIKTADQLGYQPYIVQCAALEEDLEIGAFFNKGKFSEKLDRLFDELEQARTNSLKNLD